MTISTQTLTTRHAVYMLCTAAVVRKKIEKKTHEEDSLGTISMSATDQLDLTDYVLKVYDDDDYEDTNLTAKVVNK